MYSTEAVIVTTPELKRANRTGEEFIVCRACVSSQEWDRKLKAFVEERTYIGLIALDPEIQEKLGRLDVGSRVTVGGNLRREEFSRKDGGSGSDRKLELLSLEEVTPSSGVAARDDDGGDEYLLAGERVSRAS